MIGSEEKRDAGKLTTPAPGAEVPGEDFGPNPPGGPALPAYSRAERVLIGVCLTMFVAMILATLAQIFFRYVLQIPLAWTEEAARTLFVLSMVMSMAFAYREQEHIIVDFLFEEMRPSVQRWLGLAFNLLILAFLAFWARGAWRLAEMSWGSNLITIPFFRVAYLYIWELAAITLLFIYVVLDTLRRVKGQGGAIGKDVDA